jgi:MoxR-like ATPase
MRVVSPYKYLDSYEIHDEPLFFGRDEETEILLADVVVGRLVLLSAKTGIGKTSLINAGVRPALHRRGYSTF